jgi:hypothetical protein
LRQVDIHQAKIFFLEQESKHFFDIRLERGEVGFLVRHGGAESDTAQAEKRRLFGGGESTGVRAGAAEIGTKVDAGENEVDPIPLIGAQSLRDQDRGESFRLTNLEDGVRGERLPLDRQN